jgi:hypothetical protein
MIIFIPSSYPKRRHRDLGFVADFCPVCLSPQPHTAVVVEQKNSALSDWQTVVRYKECPTCLLDTEFDPRTYKTVVAESDFGDIQNLISETFPDNKFAEQAAEIRSAMSASQHAAAASRKFAENLTADLAFARKKVEGWGALLGIILGIVVIWVGVAQSSWWAAAGTFLLCGGIFAAILRNARIATWQQRILSQIARFEKVVHPDRQTLLAAFRSHLQPKFYATWLATHWNGKRNPRPLTLGIVIAGAAGVFMLWAQQPVLDELAWIKAKHENTPAGYNQFCQTHPASAHAADARQRMDDLQYQAALAAKDPNALKRYAHDAPQSRHAEEARQQGWQRAWSKAQAENTGSAWALLAKEFPDHPQRAQALTNAESLLIALGKERRDTSCFRTYLELFPNGANRDTALSWVNTLDYEYLTNKWQSLTHGESASTNLAPAIIQCLAENLVGHQRRTMHVRFEYTPPDKDQWDAEALAAEGINIKQLPNFGEFVQPGDRQWAIAEAVRKFLNQSCAHCNITVCPTGRHQPPSRGSLIITNIGEEAESLPSDPVLRVKCGLVPSGIYGEKGEKDRLIGLSMVYSIVLNDGTVRFREANILHPPEQLKLSVRMHPMGFVGDPRKKEDWMYSAPVGWNAQREFYRKMVTDLMDQLQTQLSAKLVAK